jgi:hypothetical protein
VLLDLYCATDDVGLRWSIADRLTDISHVNMVLADDFRADLEAIIAIADSSDAIGLGWVEQLVDQHSVIRAA